MWKSAERTDAGAVAAGMADEGTKWGTARRAPEPEARNPGNTPGMPHHLEFLQIVKWENPDLEFRRPMPIFVIAKGRELHPKPASFFSAPAFGVTKPGFGFSRPSPGFSRPSLENSKPSVKSFTPSAVRPTRRVEIPKPGVRNPARQTVSGFGTERTQEG